MKMMVLRFLLSLLLVSLSSVAQARDESFNERQNIISRKLIMEILEGQKHSDTNNNRVLLCHLYEKLGDIESEYEANKTRVQIRQDSSFINYKKALFTCSSGDDTAASLPRIYDKYLTIYYKNNGIDKALSEHISVLSSNTIDSKARDILNKTFLKHLDKNKVNDGLLLSYQTAIILNEYNDSNKRTPEFVSSTKRHEISKELDNSFSSMVNPKQDSILELGIILIGWLMSLLIIIAAKKHFSAENGFSAYPNYSLWQMTDWTEKGSIGEVDKNKFYVISNTNGYYAIFKKFIADKNDFLFSGFILNESVPLTFVVFISTLLGFGLLYALNAVEGTLNTAQFVSLTYLRCVADPINWGILFPLLMIVSRIFYEYIPYSMNAFYENLLSFKEKEMLLEDIDRYYSFLDRKIFYLGILIVSFFIGAGSYTTLGNMIDVYGMMYYPTINYGIIKIPTITGWYVIFILTILVYIIMVNAKNIFATIFMLNHIYKKYFPIIKVNPFHQDGCGGFSFIGRLSLRMSLIVIITSLFGITLLLKDTYIAKNPNQLYYWIIFPAYFTVLPAVFMIPILDARRVLLAVREAYRDRLSSIGDHIRNEMFQSLYNEENFIKVLSTPQLYESLSNFKSLCQHEIPTWPIRIQPIFAFITAFVIPAIIPIIFEKLIS